MDTPAERAIAAFERLHGLTVTVHDLRGGFWHQVRPERLFHRHPLCRAVKNSPAEHRCIAFDIAALRPRLAAGGHGGYHVCHAGLLEWAVPVRSAHGLDLVLFAGPRRAGPGLPDLTRDRQPPTTGVWAANAPQPPPVDRREADDLLEALRALAARLAELTAPGPSSTQPSTQPAAPTAHAGTTDDDAHRAARIARFIATHHARPLRLADLADDLGISPGQAGRAVRRLLGTGFPAAVAEARLVEAAHLLRTTARPVLTVAIDTGFNDPSHFHVCFRRRFGMTPAAWRRADHQA